MKKQTFIFIALILGFLWINNNQTFASKTVQVEIACSTSQVKVNEPFWLVVKFKIQPGWHIYGSIPSKIGEPVQIQWSLPNSVKILDILWPAPVHKVQDTSDSYTYENEQWVLAKAVLEKPLSEEDFKVSTKINWVSCKNACVPGEATLSLNLKLPTSLVSSEQLHHWLDKTTNQKPPSEPLNWLIPLLLAIVGGILLNFMPCVLPVLSLKILDLLKPQNSTSSLTAHGFAFSLGVVLSFFGLGAILLSLKACGHELGWGFQLQSPLFTALLALLFWAMALNLWNIFEIGVLFTRFSLTYHSSLVATFANGVLASVVASPCTAPFMGTALGFALSQSWATGLLIFTGLGVGMALPFLLICLFPPLTKFFPQPGAWMETLKHFLGFMLAATVLWLLWVIGQQKDVNSLLSVMVGLLSLSIGGWIWGRWALPYRSLAVRLIARLAGLGFMIAALSIIFLTFKSSSFSEINIQWQPYRSERLQQALDRGQSVIIDFTAAWCVTCQVNKKMVLEKQEIIKAFQDDNVLLLKADWTQHDPKITQAIAQYGRHSIPLVVLYGKNKQPVLLPTLLTAENLLKNLKDLKK